MAGSQPRPSIKIKAQLPTSGLAAGAVGAVALGLGVAGFPIWVTALWVVFGSAGAGWLEIRNSAPLRQSATRAMSVVQRLGETGPAAIDAEELDDLGEFGDALRRFIGRQRTLDASVGRFLQTLQVLPMQIRESNREVDESGEAIGESVEEAASLLAHINTSIRSINEEVDSLSRSAEEASASILEMGSTNEEVARIAGSLHQAADASTTGVHQISASIRQVADSADTVQSMAEDSASAMVEMDRAIQEVTTHVADAAELTDRVSTGAQEGSAAVTATIDGIAEIRDQTQGAKAVVERLASRIGEIGEIVNVIGGINDETNLLSLNAAIIAAQAGEQGKAFAVVANHVKILAQRTASSTGEIESLIKAVQDESANAVEAMAAGIRSVEMGVERSCRAGEDLSRIRISAQDASARVGEIARATAEQSRNSKHVTEAVQRTSSMVQQISTAMIEQSSAGQTLLRNAEESLELCRQVHRSTEEQRESGRFITESISAIGEMIRSIQQNTEGHRTASDSMSGAVNQILEVARKSGTGTQALQEQLGRLHAEALSLANATQSEGR
ncbi:MAG: methyl-accepting chemotaxis protein [Deltaproteobacteria bacterium]|nr:methyl-accepting chemotaxis protein [Deltaproteobacteria bacterium]MBW2362523.1 methyl-accepting chemotaxis protein [Deltaproteobacteria bacterium]